MKTWAKLQVAIELFATTTHIRDTATGGSSHGRLVRLAPDPAPGRTARKKLSNQLSSAFVTILLAGCSSPRNTPPAHSEPPETPGSRLYA